MRDGGDAAILAAIEAERHHIRDSMSLGRDS